MNGSEFYTLKMRDGRHVVTLYNANQLLPQIIARHVSQRTGETVILSSNCGRYREIDAVRQIVPIRGA